MADRADERSKVLGGLVCLAAVVGAALFLYGLSVESYWALALPLAVALLFVLGLVFWIGWTIATVRVEAEGEPLISGGGPGGATRPDPKAGTASAAGVSSAGAAPGPGTAEEPAAEGARAGGSSS